MKSTKNSLGSREGVGSSRREESVKDSYYTQQGEVERSEKKKPARCRPGSEQKQFPKSARTGDYWFSSQATVASLDSGVSANPAAITAEYRQLV